jgi:hypothetical protein
MAKKLQYTEPARVLDVDMSAGHVSFHTADAGTPPESGGPGALILSVQAKGLPAVPVIATAAEQKLFRDLLARGYRAHAQVSETEEETEETETP